MATTRIRDYEVSPSDSFFFDTNVWLFIYGPIANVDTEKQKAYSSLLGSITGRGAGIMISSLVVAEFINRILRIEFRNWKKATDNVNANFKNDFRNTADYLFAKGDAVNHVKEILNLATRKTDDFNNIDIPALLDRFDQHCDYNDLYIATMCERGHHKLVTDDGDFEAAFPDLQIISA